jgi:hypothetical protein
MSELKLLHSEENIGVNFYKLGFGYRFLDMTPKAQASNKRKKRINFIQI